MRLRVPSRFLPVLNPRVRQLRALNIDEAPYVRANAYALVFALVQLVIMIVAILSSFTLGVIVVAFGFAVLGKPALQINEAGGSLVVFKGNLPANFLFWSSYLVGAVLWIRFLSTARRLARPRAIVSLRLAIRDLLVLARPFLQGNQCSHVRLFRSRRKMERIARSLALDLVQIAGLKTRESIRTEWNRIGGVMFSASMQPWRETLVREALLAASDTLTHLASGEFWKHAPSAWLPEPPPELLIAKGGTTRATVQAIGFAAIAGLLVLVPDKLVDILTVNS